MFFFFFNYQSFNSLIVLMLTFICLNVLSFTVANSHYRTFKSVVKPKPKCGSGIGFQFRTLGTKENFLS